MVIGCGTFDIGKDQNRRWLNLASNITALLVKYAPQALVIEQNFVYKNPRTTAVLNQLRGGVLLLCAQYGVSVVHVDNNSAKKKVLGSTRYWDQQQQKYLGITKDMMFQAVRRAICVDSCSPQDDDMADAIALGLTFYDAPITPAPLPRKTMSVESERG